MLKGYRVQMERKDNRTGKKEKFVFNREKSFPSCKKCYLDASNVLMGMASYPDVEWAMTGAGLLTIYAEERERISKMKELVHTSEYYTYIVTIVCEE